MSTTKAKKDKKVEKALDGVFPDKWSLDCFLEDLDESLPGWGVPLDKVQKFLDFIRNNISVEDMPER